MKLSPTVQRRVAAGVLSAGHARSLLAIADAIIFDTELGALPGFGQAMLSMVGDTLVTVITFPLMTAVFVTVFHDLKLRKEGHDLEARVEALTAGA